MTDDSNDIDWDDTSDKDLESNKEPTQEPSTSSTVSKPSSFSSSISTSTPTTKPKGQLGVLRAGSKVNRRRHQDRLVVGGRGILQKGVMGSAVGGGRI